MVHIECNVRGRAPYIDRDILGIFCRVIIIPWPPYTSAEDTTDNLLLKGSHGGDLIEGELKTKVSRR